MYRIHEIKLKIDEDRSLIPELIQKKLKAPINITQYKIIKESIDARDKGDILFVYTVDFEVDDQTEQTLSESGKLANKLEKAPDLTYVYPTPGETPLKNRPVIAGFGPCGLFAALILAELGYRPIVIERGRPAPQRVEDVERFWKEGILDEESNVQFGEGGAGTFSDGKLTTGIKDKRIRKVLEELATAGAGDEILYKQNPHIGTDVLRKTVINLRKKIIELGGEIRFETRLDGICYDKSNQLTSIQISSKNKKSAINTENLILAIGHSARDTVRALYNLGVPMEAKPFSIGVRIEHPQKSIDEAQYGKKMMGRLPPATYKLSHRCQNGRGVYTFCMCPGGEVIVASSQKGGVVTNGMSNRARDGFYANSGLLVDVKTSDFASPDPLAGIEFQEKYERIAFEKGGENYTAPKTTWGEFASDATSAKPVIESIPAFAATSLKEAMPYLAKKLKGFNDPNAILTAVESRSSSPVRINRDEHYQSSISGLYPGGEGAGYAGGIVSSAVDGIRIAEEIVKNYSNKIR